MGWEVFYQATLIPTRSTKLTSKREGNCNVIIIGPTDHGLHVIQLRESAYTWLANFILSSSNLTCLGLIFLATAMSSSLYRLIVVTTSSLSYQLGHQSVLALSGAEVIRVAYHAFLASGGGISSSINESYWEPMVAEWTNSANKSHWWELRVKWQEGRPTGRS